MRKTFSYSTSAPDGMAMTVPPIDCCRENIALRKFLYEDRAKFFLPHPNTSKKLRDVVRYRHSQAANGMNPRSVAVNSDWRPEIRKENLTMDDLDNEPDQEKRIEKLRSE